MHFKIVLMLLLATVSSHLTAQLCQGSLGDPLINISFGSGQNPGAPLSAAATTYSYASGYCPLDGYYTVLNSTSGCYDNTWHTIQRDHTGNSNGYFMLVNASYQPSAFYVDTVRGLCGNTTYEFAAWIMNMVHQSSCNGNTIPPNLTLQIEKPDGTLVQTYNTGNIAAQTGPLWRQFGFFFSTPANVTDIVLRIINNAPGGCGNDLALDDITFSPCGPLLTPAISGVPPGTAILCEGTAGAFNFSCGVSGGFTNPAFQWQQSINGSAWTDIPGGNSTTLTINFPASAAVGIYTFRLSVAEADNMSSAQCRINSPVLTVQVSGNPVTTVMNNGPLCEGNTLSLTATGGTTYSWSGPEAFTATGPQPAITDVQLRHAGKYFVSIKNEAGCEHRDSSTVIIKSSPTATTSFSNGSICRDSSIVLSAAGGGTYEWSPAIALADPHTSSTLASPLNSVRYMVVVSNNEDCRDTAFIDINVLNKPVANAGPDKVIIEGQAVLLTGSINGPGNIYTWSPPAFINDIHLLQPTVNPPSDISYILNVSSGIGCGTSSDTMFVKVYKGIYIPTAFSPNGDLKNDTWNIPALGAFPEFELFVFNRYGQKVFDIKNINRPWDGMYNGGLLPMGVYGYILNIKYKPVLKGTVMLIR